MANEGLKFRGLDLVHPENRIPPGRCSIAQNVRAYWKGAITFRNLLSSVIETLGAAVHSLRRLNDLTPNGPVSGYTLIGGAGSTLYANSTSIATGMSGNPLSLIPFRPNTSVQPWMYVGDSAVQGAVTLDTEYLIDGSPVNFPSNGMAKVRSDGLIYKMGIKEPQIAPIVGTQNTSVVSSGSLLATAIPWTNYLGANPNYNYGESTGYPDPTPDGTAPYVVNCANATTITITSLTGSATINGGAKSPSSAGPSTGLSTNPGHYIQIQGTGATPATASVVVGAFTDGSGNVIPVGVAPLFIPSVVDVGAVIGVSQAITVPFGAQSFQIGINSTGGTFSSNSGSFAISVTVTTDALPSVLSILGNLTAYYWGDSPTSGSVAAYIWKNPGDPSGSGPTRSISNAVGNTTGNSFIFDANFGTSCYPVLPSGIPGVPAIDISSGNSDISVPMQWTTLNPESVATGSIPVFAPAIPGTTQNTNFSDFNFCLLGNIYVPQAGNYTFVITCKDDFIWGIGGGATVVSSSAVLSQELTSGTPKSKTISTSTSGSTFTGGYGQTITAAQGLPLLPRATPTSALVFLTPLNWGEGGIYAASTVVVHFPSAGIYPIEFDYDFWFHSGRIFIVMASPLPLGTPTIIPPLPSSVRQETQYRYVYRSSATGAVSNPSPETSPETVPVTSNTVTSYYSTDPQVDVVDYYRIDSTTASFTYVATGPNDNLGGGGTNTPITDSLLDTELGTQLLEYDNYEPFPSIDLPQKGTCDVAGGVITWVSGGAIGGTATGFNTRWLAGTVILIGSPTSLAYTLIARPVSNTITIPGVPDGTGLVYEIEEPILAAQPLPYLFGPTDNINFIFGVGDQLRPGTLYWCKGSNLDSAPDTNQQDVTDPSEPLVNGAMSGGRGVLFSTERAWVIMPNFYNAEATATGTVGSTWTLEATSINRGLYIPRCVAVEGGGNIFFRVKDGIHISPGGAASKSITDEDLYPLFPHEGSSPASVTRAGYTIYPPDDTKPQGQKFSIADGYLYYDYLDATSTPRSLVFDIAAMGWVWDKYSHPATIHALEEGAGVNGTLVGCSDGTVSTLSSSGTESETAVILTPAIGGRGYQHMGEMVVEYSTSNTITLKCYAADEGNGSYGPSTITLPSTGGLLTKYWLRPSANKWKLMWFEFTSTTPFVLNCDGFCCFVKDWGASGPYRVMHPFGDSGGEG